jgi:hypothetical protein
MEMKNVIEAILKRHGLLEAFNTSPDFHLKIDNSPWMPLVIERHGDEISIAHYGELNGDLIRDPELTFSFSADWTPTSITQDPVGRYAEVFPIVDGQQMVRPKLLRELKSFANLWARNLKEQGFINDDVVATSLTHEALLTPAASCRRDGVPRA